MYILVQKHEVNPYRWRICRVGEQISTPHQTVCSLAQLKQLMSLTRNCQVELSFCIILFMTSGCYIWQIKMSFLQNPANLQTAYIVLMCLCSHQVFPVFWSHSVNWDEIFHHVGLPCVWYVHWKLAHKCMLYVQWLQSHSIYAFYSDVPNHWIVNTEYCSYMHVHRRHGVTCADVGMYPRSCVWKSPR